MYRAFNRSPGNNRPLPGTSRPRELHGGRKRGNACVPSKYVFLGIRSHVCFFEASICPRVESFKLFTNTCISWFIACVNIVAAVFCSGVLHLSPTMYSTRMQANHVCFFPKVIEGSTLGMPRENFSRVVPGAYRTSHLPGLAGH